MLNITVLSGGSGNDKLIRGLKSLYRNCDIKVITNAYDNGKSTGICRSVTNTLGVSDIRKNHSRMYEAMTDHPNKKLLEFYNNRYDLLEGKELECVTKLLTSWDLLDLNIYAQKFFSENTAYKYKYKSFNIANIIYSEMYAELGYEKTNKYFCNLLGIDDFVLLNSFDNVYLKAETENGYIIDDEGELVEYKNPYNKIINTFYDGLPCALNRKAIDRILNSDLIIISTGTFWSSIYPTLQYLDFYKYINESKAKKIWAINNEEDKDAYGISSNDFIGYMLDLGLNLSDFTILENLDARDSLRLLNDKFNIIQKSMGNVNGKHDGYLYAKAILSIYYNLYIDYDNIIFDFDDTIWSRDAQNNPDNFYLSVNNISNINKYLSEKALVISGNTFDSIKNKLSYIFGTKLDNFNIKIWADANSTLYYKNQKVDYIKSLLINKNDYAQIKSTLETKFGLKCSVNSEDSVFNIKVKPLINAERLLLSYYLNDYLFKETKSFNNYEARITGTSTVDIVHKNNSKLEIFNYLNLKNLKTLYIGDEIDSGNDRDIANICTNSINVESIEETNTILKLLIGDNLNE